MATKRNVRRISVASDKESIMTPSNYGSMKPVKNKAASVYVKNYIKAIDKMMRLQMEKSNVPAFFIMSKTIDTERYFMNHEQYQALVGNMVGLIDRMMLNAICQYLVKDIEDELNSNSSIAGIPGVWDSYSIYNIAAAVITIMKTDFDDSLYLTALQYAVISKDDLRNLDRNQIMLFSDYTPNKFFIIYSQIRAKVLEVITGIINSSFPKAMLAKDKDELQSRYLMMFHNYMKNDMDAVCDILLDKMGIGYPANVDDNGYSEVHMADQDDNQRIGSVSHILANPAKEAYVRSFVEYMEKPLLVFYTVLLQESGFTQNMINLMLGKSRVHIIYDDPAAADNPVAFGDIGITYRLNYVADKSNSLYISHRFLIGDILRIAVMDPTFISNTKKTAFGTQLRNNFMNLCGYLANVYMRTVEELKAQEASDMEKIQNSMGVALDDILSDQGE